MYILDAFYFLGVWDSLYICTKDLFLPRVLWDKITVIRNITVRASICGCPRCVSAFSGSRDAFWKLCALGPR